MFNPEKATMLPPRIKRMGMRLHPFEYTIEDIAGKCNVADSLSRLLLAVTEEHKYVDTYMEKVLSIITHDVPAMRLDAIQKDTQEDDTLRQLFQIVQTGQWPTQISEEMQPYKILKHLFFLCNLPNDDIMKVNEGSIVRPQQIN
jgi:hypothetical protein